VTARANRPSHHAHRVIFIDLARALAVVMMLYGHTVDALLGQQYRTGLWFDVWQFQRGLTSCLFLLLSGFAFSIATTRHWAVHIQVSPALFRRIRRFGLFVVLGYALHFPVDHVADLLSLSDEGWRGFVAVDVLQLIGVTLVLLQVLVLVSQSRRVFMTLGFGLTVLIVAATPTLWRGEWGPTLPPALAAYVSPSTGSQFPVFPWSAYVLLGAALGQIYARWGAGRLGAFTIGGLLVPGTLIVSLVLAGRALSFQPFGTGDWSWVPAEFLMRCGASLAVLGAIAHASRRLAHLPHLFAAIAQESLLIYFVHLCIVYGSIWNDGLAHWYAQALGPATTVLIAVLLIAAMTTLAWGWNRLKHMRPRTARWVSAGVAVLLIWLLT
jgi:uncharacterized membrane protein